ncbi:acyltransferase domain-containing protein [Streptomyces sp. NBC_00193]|uniref:type I polyketide synthase n=1 Tax=Streptomyces sp. NBC_00193 TaxID=2975675 RepID=UPI0022527D49|nr:beta-ketoacyl synthase N-terminal-like domain-containing protein [Streptomyces sp. NBC_00193]MCX5295328.1 acyltransferase domain-containing protein [Streptomyces sp. NBC_00193]
MSDARPDAGGARAGSDPHEEAGAEIEAVAVVGMAGRFPGARTTEEFWDHLVAGRDCLEELDDTELLTAGVPASALAGPGYVRRAAALDGFAEFDAEFFGLPPSVAAAMDPQQRLFLESCWHALEDAGHDPAARDGAVGVFAAPSFSGYFGYNLLSHHDPRVLLGSGTSPALIHALTLTDPNFFATRVAHALDLRGPALTVQTACSGSLVAVHLACQSLLSGETDLALAGGMTVKVPHRAGYLHEPGSMMSADGFCRPFDAAANGTVFGSGGGVVALKRLSDALADGDRIRAVVRGTAVNNDGSLKMGFTAPSVEMQAAVIAEALAVAGLEPHEVGYVEAHGTGTVLGDPVETAALRQALDPAGDRTAPCLIGSAKGNIGHLEAASGVVGLIKAVLALEHRTLPATAHFTAPNPELGLGDGPFEVVAATRQWTGPGPLVAGVSSLGVGGTNAHVVLTEAPHAPPRRTPAPTPAAVPAAAPDAAPVLLVSARTPEALRDAARELAGAIGPDTDLMDVAHTLAGRRAFGFRAAVSARSPERAAALLRADRPAVRVAAAPPAPVLLLPGQGSPYPRMGEGLYRAGGVFRRELDRCAELFAAGTGRDPRDAVFRGDAADLLRTDVAQPALFCVEYALARTLESHGVRPAALAGHSVGEFAAACLAGVMELPDAVRLVAARGRLMHAAPAGTMLSVRTAPEQVLARLDGSGLELAAVNEPGACVVAGPPEQAAAFSALMTTEGFTVTALRTPHAFHTAAMDEAAERFAELAGRVPLSAPAVPLLSNVTGDWMTDAEATDPERWARQMRSTVRWSDCVRTLLTGTGPDGPGRALVETGPGRTLASAARRVPGWSDAHLAVSAMRHPEERIDDGEALSRALGALWETGVEVDWSGTRHGRERRVPLPGYPFRRVRHWIDPAEPARPAGAGARAEVRERPRTAEQRAEVTPEGAGRGAAEVLAGIWAEVLGVASVRPDEDFFDLGGDSVLAARVCGRAQAFGLDLTPKDVFEHPTVSRLAVRVS